MTQAACAPAGVEGGQIEPPAEHLRMHREEPEVRLDACMQAEGGYHHADLAPAAGRRAEVNHMAHAVEYGEGLVDLQELVGAPRPPALLLGLAVVDVPLVLRSNSANSDLSKDGFLARNGIARL
jgi:hypothetical protein